MSADKNYQLNKRQNYDGNRRLPYYKQRYFYGPNTRNYRPEDNYRYNKHPSSQDMLAFTRSKHVKKKFKKNPSRPTSPVVGSEEYMTQKIKKTSAIIMRHLLSPEENIIPVKNNTNDFIPLETDHSKKHNTNEKLEPGNERKRTRSIGASESTTKKSSYNVEEIQNKIMNYLSNLNDGRKKNFISTSTSVYDEAVHQIVKQKRLEISRALRNVYMQTPDITKSTEWINSIIPDMGIKIEDLPQEVLEALQITFSNPEDVEITPVVDLSETDTVSINEVTVKIKQEECYEPRIEVVEIFASDIMKLDSPRKERVKAQGERNVGIRDSTSQEKTIQSQDSQSFCNKNIISEQKMVKLVESQSFLESSEKFRKNQSSKNVSTTATQTGKMTIDDLLQRNFRKPPKTFSTAVKRMLQIDEYIAKLTEYRQNLFSGLKITKVNKKGKQTSNVAKDIVAVKGKNKNSFAAEDKANSLNKEKDCSNSRQSENEHSNCEQKLLEFGNITEKMLVLKIFEDKLVAGTESGRIYLFSLEDGHCIQILEVTTVPITCMHYTREEQGKPYMFVGSFGSSLKVYNFYSNCILQDIQFEDSVQCMDENWGYLFLGCMQGTILRYSIKKNHVEYEERFDRNPIFVLRATQEGARMVLLIGSRNSAVIIRDAISGLHLRTMENIMCPTVYSMIMEKHLVYCGTTTHNILVFNFHSGKLMHTYKATNAKGIGSMKVVGKCLFASCHNGKVYAFNLETNKHIGTLDGPGGVIISMEVLKNQVMVGTMSSKFSSIPIPRHILNHI